MSAVMYCTVTLSVAAGASRTVNRTGATPSRPAPSSTASTGAVPGARCRATIGPNAGASLPAASRSRYFAWCAFGA